MARSRNIKPSFFFNPNLAEVTPLTRLLFIGLWTIADREGRLEDIPKKIKALVLPYDNIDINKALNELQNHGFLVRYSVNENNYIQIVNFLKHQNPHMKEQASEIPEIPLHHTSTIQAPYKHGTCPADSLNPLIDSLNPLPIGEFFDKCWNLYPNKTGKGSISDKVKKDRHKLGDEFIRCIERYKAYIKKGNIEMKYIKAGSTFWNSGYVDYLDENYHEAFGDLKTDEEKTKNRERISAEIKKQELEDKRKIDEKYSGDANLSPKLKKIFEEVDV